MLGETWKRHTDHMVYLWFSKQFNVLHFIKKEKEKCFENKEAK
jgi:hypothetical protein